MPTLLTENLDDIEAMVSEPDRDDKALSEELMEWYGELKEKRALWDRLWQEVRELVRPNAEDFTKRMPAAMNRKQRIYDDYPTTCLRNLTAGIQSTATNAATRWFGLTTGDDAIDERPEVALWLQKSSNIGYDEIYHAEAGFNAASEELYSDWGGFGTGVINFLESDERIHFRSIPLAECYISENEYNIVDVVFRKFRLTRRAAIKRFGNALPKDVREGNNKESHLEFIHAVFPIDSEIKFRSVYIYEGDGSIVEKGMFREFPYCVLRWTKMAGDVYGRSPGTDCLQNLPPGLTASPEQDKWFAERAHKLGLSTAQANALRTDFVQFQADQAKGRLEQGEQFQAQQEAAITKLKGEYGSRWDAAVDGAKRVVAEFGGKDVQSFLESSGLGNDPRLIRMMVKIGQTLHDHSVITGTPRISGAFTGGPAQAAAELAKMDSDPVAREALTKASHPRHDEFVKRRSDLMRAAVPVEK